MHITRSTGELATAAATAFAGAVVCTGSLANGIAWGSAGPQPGVFPFYVGCLIILGSAVNAANVLRWTDPGVFASGTALRAVGAFFLPMIVFALVSVWLGLYIGMGLYAAYATRVTARFRPHMAVLFAFAVVAVNFTIFEVVFKVPLLKGPVLEYFGIY
jgi:hypothetical protein